MPRVNKEKSQRRRRLPEEVITLGPRPALDQSSRTRDALRASEQAGGTLNDIDNALDKQEQPSGLPWRNNTDEPASDDTTKPPSETAESLRDQESNPSQQTKLQPDNKKPKSKISRRRLAKRWVIGGLIGLIMTAAGTLVSLLPNRLDIVSAQIERMFYQRVEHFVERRSQYLFFRYLAVHVFGNHNAIQACQQAGQVSFTIHADCFYSNDDDTVFPQTKSGLAFAAWKNSRIERRLGPVNISYSPNSVFPPSEEHPNGRRGPAWAVIMPNTLPHLIDPNDATSGVQQLFDSNEYTDGTRQGRAQLRRAILNSLRDNAHFGLIARMRAANALKNKYSLQRCIFGCHHGKLDDWWTAKVAGAKKVWHSVIVNAVYRLGTRVTALVVACMFQGGQACTEDSPEWRQRYQSLAQEVRAERPDLDSKLRFAEQFADHLAKNGSVANFILNLIKNKLASRASLQIVNAIPVVGQAIALGLLAITGVAAAFSIVQVYAFLHTPAAQYMSTIMKNQFYGPMYMMMKLATDEDRNLANTATDHDIELKGTQTSMFDGMERSVAWNAMIGNPGAFDTNLGALFAQKAYAQQAAPDDYPYNCGLETGQVFCPTWQMNTANRLAEIGEATPPLGLDTEAGQQAISVGSDIMDVINTPLDAIGDLVPVPQAIDEWVENNVGPHIRAATDYLLSPPIKTAEELNDGAKVWDGAYMGANTTVNDMLRGRINEQGQYEGYGARAGTPQEVAAIDEQLRQEHDTEFASLSWWQKLTSPDYHQSFASQLALALPGNASQAMGIINPGTVLGVIGDIFSGKARAQNRVDLEPGALYGGQPQYTFGPEIDTTPLRDEHDTTPCPNDRLGDNGEMKPLGAEDTRDMGLGRAEFTTSNICLLDETIAEDLTAPFTDAPYDTDEAAASAQSNFGGGGSGAATGQFAWPIPAGDFNGITSCYGPRAGGFHYGVDMIGDKPMGQQRILAADGGKVIQSGFNGGAGYMVTIDHGSDTFTLYMHMIKQPEVNVNQNVSKGDVIGFMGSTGNSTGPHLHFTVAHGEPRNSAPYAINPFSGSPPALQRTGPYTQGDSC